METVEVVIRLPKEAFERCKMMPKQVKEYNFTIAKALADGTVLPKGHGDLKDYNEIGRLWKEGNYDSILSALLYAPTVIEADRDGE